MRWNPRHGRVMLPLLVIILGVTAVGILAWGPSGDDDDVPAESGDASSVPFEPGTGNTVATEPEVTAAPGSISQPAIVDDGTSIRVARIEHVQGEATRPGEVGGPALRLSIEVDNHGSERVALDATVVDLSYGDPPTSAVRLVEPGSVPFPATVEPGDTTTAVFVFAVPEDQRSDIAITVSLAPGIPTVVFTGHGDEL